MLGLDIGWNCYISLGNDSNTSVKATNDQTQQQHLRGNLQEATDKLMTQNISSHVAPRQNNMKRKCLKKYQKQKVLHQKKRLFSQHKNYSYTQSLPVLKFTNGNENRVHDGTSLVGMTSQIVKFDLSNLDRKKSQVKAREKESKATAADKKKLFRFDSGDSTASSSSDSELHYNSTSKKDKRHFNLEINNSKTSVTSSRNYQKLNSLSASSNKNQEEENSSHRTNHSGRTLSETEIGNAVSIIFYDKNNFSIKQLKYNIVLVTLKVMDIKKTLYFNKRI